MEPRPSFGVALRRQRLILVALALLGAWLLGRYSGDGARAELTLDQPLTPVAQLAAQGVAPVQTHASTPGATPRTATQAVQPRPPHALAPNPVPLRAPARVTAAPTTTTRTTTTTTPTSTRDPAAPDGPADPIGPSRTEPPPPEAPLELPAATDVTATAAATSARVTWQTNFPTTSQGAAGTSGVPSVWTPAGSTPSFTHELDFTNLTPGTTYNLWLHDVDEWNRPVTTPLTVTTAPRSGPSAATVGNGAILIDGEPFFPLTTWSTCTNFIPARIALGFNLFMGEGCGKENRLAASLDGKAFGVVDAKTHIANQPGVIGWYYPDELDGRLSGPVSTSTVTTFGVTPPPGMISFLTLTNHFFTGAAPLPIGRSLYPELVSLADVIGFDLYPLQNWCRNDAYQAVYDAQRELEALAAGKPTFQWIEVRRMDCSVALSPTPATVAAETWLAIAGGADGIGYFPDEWTPAVGDEIRALNAEISDLAPALLAPEVPATAPMPIKVGARTLNGALYVIAVNSSTSPVDAQLQVDGAAARTFDVRGEARQVTAADNTITDHFDGLGVHVYVAGPDGWTPSALP